MGSFVNQLNAFKNKVSDTANLVVKKIVFDIGTRLAERTPVGDPTYWKSPPPPGYVGGRARGNWQYGINAPNVTNTSPVDKTGNSVTAHIGAAMPNDALGMKHYITNSVPYIERLEHGWSRQAPHGMVGLVTTEFEPIVKAAAEQVT